MPTTATSTFEPSANRLDPVFAPDLSRVLNIAPAGPALSTDPPLVYSKGQIMAEDLSVSSAPLWRAYPGTAGAKGLLQYTVSVEFDGSVHLAGEFGQMQHGCPMWMPGGAIWRTQELIGLDAQAIADMSGAIVEGNLTTGLIKL